MSTITVSRASAYVEQNRKPAFWMKVSELTTACVFFLRFTHKEILDCPKYLRIDGVNVGCVFPYEKLQRFNTLNTWLYSDNGSLVTEQEHNLIAYGIRNDSYLLLLDNNCMAMTG